MRVEVHLRFDQIGATIDAVTPEALVEGMEVIRAVSVARTPVETGRLAGSASVTVDTQDGNHAAKIHYDGPYARYQHERLDLRHEHGGQAKYLESAMADEADNALGVIAAHIRRAI